jgi:hypothetical protein
VEWERSVPGMNHILALLQDEQSTGGRSPPATGR